MSLLLLLRQHPYGVVAPPVYDTEPELVTIIDRTDHVTLSRGADVALIIRAESARIRRR